MTPNTESATSEESVTLTVDLSAMTISDMRAIARIGTPMSTDEMIVLIPQVFDALHRAGLGGLPLDEIQIAISQIWTALGKLGQASTTPS